MRLIVLLVCARVASAVAQTKEAALPEPLAIDSALVSRLLREAMTNNPALKAANSRDRAAALNAE